MLRTIEGESVLIPVGEVPDPRFDNCMINMNETSAFLWEFFSEDYRTEAEAVAACEAEFEAPEGMIAAHIRNYLTQYTALGLLILEK